MTILAGPAPTTLADYFWALDHGIKVHPDTFAMLESEAKIVAQVATSDTPAYGINTGLGSNLGYRLNAEELAAFQLQLIRERAVAVGTPLWPETGRAVLLARILTAARGKTGMSPPLFKHLCQMFDAGLSPLIPKYGSLGASDLTQTACWALGVVADPSSQISLNGTIIPAPEAFDRTGLKMPALAPKDGLLLASQTGLTTALAAQALQRARQSLDLARRTAALSMAGFAANTSIFSVEIASLAPDPHQDEVAQWFRTSMEGCNYAPTRIQDALSFRTAVAVFAAAEGASGAATQAWEAAFNTVSDSPAVIDGALRSTAHFQTPSLALALEQASLSFAMLAHGACQRIQKLMMPELSGLPRFLAKEGGAAAGLVPVQKTAAALLADVRRYAHPTTLDPIPVSETVEDMAPMTPQAALKLTKQTEAFDLLCATEALVAVRAIDLRGLEGMSDKIKSLCKAVQSVEQTRIAQDGILTSLHGLGPIKSQL